MTPDEMARNALHKIDKHEAVCTERYGNIDNKLNLATNQVAALGIQVHGRLDGIMRLMWTAVGSALILGISAIGALVMIAFKH